MVASKENETKQFLKRKRKEYIAELPFIGKVGVFIGLFIVWCEDVDGHRLHYRCSRFNPFHPLFWTLVLCLAPATILQYAYSWIKDSIVGIKELIQTQRTSKQ